mmetsp:Transcript_35456/g.31961  ORF Transcript_35456/g.31961 Transcript_35456/m.31961 type:complete len:128 (+) Transcript_35456:258-641(+)|eukprot:CAMPEP_0114603334 /NCGR_PEP_ID=MMETSP0125-20121206/25770_1 /TAXON_ID=485358 ORGANISM="Aristerostoma sp., Strain ATCC 50986" /NCGR_SAMPLE_ID=MMETSP0125 /ASSEMBLY_ACC=CAM_ASM_000245 /LENGTH=127 /DNA_ID=CAMNT_0001814093 /DNA_START=191 /DNA_END=574 /DNA_ORIENTATION=+
MGTSETRTTKEMIATAAPIPTIEEMNQTGETETIDIAVTIIVTPIATTMVATTQGTLEIVITEITRLGDLEIQGIGIIITAAIGAGVGKIEEGEEAIIEAQDQGAVEGITIIIEVAEEIDLEAVKEV